MIENENRIEILKHIKSVCKRQLVAPIIAIIAMIVLVTLIPFNEVFNPEPVKGVFNVNPDQKYINITTDKLTYTGYDVKNGFGQEFSYYYAIKGKKCVFVLVPARPITRRTIDNVTFNAKVIKPNSTYDKMVSLLAKDLNWTEDGLKSISSDYVISAADYNTYKFIIGFWLIIIVVGLAFLRIILAVLGYKDPYRYPVCSFLSRDESRDLIDEAKDELDSENYLQINDTYITENYFIALDPNQVHVIPLKDIIWVYRLGRRGIDIRRQTLTYTIRFITRDGVTIKVKHKSSDEAMAIIKSLKATEYDIITGHSDEKRQRVIEIINEKTEE